MLKGKEGHLTDLEHLGFRLNRLEAFADRGHIARPAVGTGCRQTALCHRQPVAHMIDFSFQTERRRSRDADNSRCDIPQRR